jgi:hypothetical protein
VAWSADSTDGAAFRGIQRPSANRADRRHQTQLVFYDEWYEAGQLGSGGDLKLQDGYKQAELVVPFFSEHYTKPWSRSSGRT